ncbi:ABC transporter permease [Sphingomonas sp. PB4P5]|uniref:ABC transporter permease n=1 Tax=Parasphingomonas puruogangriensis TaxID=3096155 RepID=UPI002FCC84FD
MWRNYLTVGLRALLKNRTYAFINILGLAIGLAACLLISLFVREHLSFDRFVPNADNIYQVQAVTSDAQTGAVDPIQMSPYAVGPALKKDFPQIARLAYMTNWQPVIMDKGEPRQLTITQVGADFFKIFDLPFVRGSAATALPDTNSIVVSQKTALSLFGSEDAIGRTVTAQAREGKRDFRVTGVYKNLPRNSHNRMGMAVLADPARFPPGQENNWGQYSGYNYLALQPGTDVAALNAQLDAWKERAAPKDMVGGQLISQTADTSFKLVALPDIHLGTGKSGPSANEEDAGTIVTFAILAALILVMACVNFTNLATARASQRAREVALRKVLGASRGQLIAQFLAESVLVSAIAMLVALAIVELSLPWLRTYLNMELALQYFGGGGVLLPALVLLLAVGLAGGLYPAFYLTRFQPARVLKANKSAAEAEGSGVLRNGLVVVQFAISIGLIICTAIVYSQTAFLRSADPGFKRSGLIQVENMSRTAVRPSIDTIEQQVLRTPGVKHVARTSIAVATDNRMNQSVMLPGKPTPLTLGSYSVGFDYPETMGMKLLAGRTLQRDRAMDDATVADVPDDAKEKALVARGMNVMVNESSVRQMGFASPQAAVGKQIRMSFVDPKNGTVPATIVGVLGDTRFRSAREQVEDMIMYHDEYNLPWLVVRVEDPDPAAVMARIGAVWKRIVPTVPFDAEFSDDKAADLYRSDVATGQVFAGFAILSVIIGCLGLFGLAAFTAERRTKEIGIRKVLGAGTRDIVRLLVWQFTRPVVVANLIAWPVAWWMMRGWLNGFDDRIALGPLPFLAAGGLALVIATTTIASHAWRVARENPIRALRYE